MRAASRALAALTVTAAVLTPALPALATTPVQAVTRAPAMVPIQDPAPSPSSPGSAAPFTVKTPSGATAEIRVDDPSGTVRAPGVAADSWVVADLDSGAVLASLNADAPIRPASTLKLLTAVTVAPRLAPEQPYRAVKADETAEGNRVVLYAGLKYTVADLLHAALLPSANDAAAALARANGGVATTVEQMNQEAQRLGASSTTVRNPSGLDEDGQLTTAHDMAIIGRAAFANPEIAEYLKLRVVDFPGKMENGKRVIYPIYNHNRTLSHKSFVGTMGGKSGYTSKAGRTLVAAADRDGHRLVVTLFRIGGNTYAAGEHLLNWAFANLDRLRPVGQLPEASAPAPQFDRTITPLPSKGEAPAARPAGKPVADDAPTAPGSGSGWAIPSVPLLPSPLTLLTIALGVLVLLRARVYWALHRHRTGWVELDDWAGKQARSARRAGAYSGAGPTGPASAESATSTDRLLGAPSA